MLATDMPIGEAELKEGEPIKLSIDTAVGMLKNLKLKHQQGAAAKQAAAGEEGAAPGGGEQRAATLHEVAGIITTLTRDHLGSLLLHPGHATVGVFYLAQRHEMVRLADHIDGKRVGDRELVQELIRYVDISDSIYPDRYPELVQEQQVVKESDILCFYKQVHKLQPGYYVARGRDEDRELMWVIRGTHDIHDLLTDLCGVATPIPGGAAHWGMWRAAGWLLDTQWERILGYLKQHPGHSLKIVGHSMGAGVGALLALRLNTEEAFRQQLGDTKVSCLGVATAACLSSELASAVTPYMTTLVMRYDLVPRFSTGQVEELQRELMEVDYKVLLHEDLMAHEAYRNAIQLTAGVASKVLSSPLARAAGAKAGGAAPAVKAGAKQLAELQAKLASHAGGGAPAAAAAEVTVAADGASGGAVVATGVAVAEEPGGVRGVSAASAVESFDDAGEAGEAATAAAEGRIVNAVLFAPGRLLYVRPKDDHAEGEEHFELVDGKGGERFRRIVLRSSCMADHFPHAYKMGLTDVLQQMGGDGTGGARAAAAAAAAEEAAPKPAAS